MKQKRWKCDSGNVPLLSPRWSVNPAGESFSLRDSAGGAGESCSLRDSAGGAGGAAAPGGSENRAPKVGVPPGGREATQSSALPSALVGGPITRVAAERVEAEDDREEEFPGAHGGSRSGLVMIGDEEDCTCDKGTSVP